MRKKISYRFFIIDILLLIFCSALQAQRGEKYPNSLLKEEMIDAPWIVYKDDPIPFLWIVKDANENNLNELHCIAIYDISNGVKYYENHTRFTPRTNNSWYGNLYCLPLDPDPTVPENVPNQVYYKHWPSHPEIGNNWWYRIEQIFLYPGSNYPGMHYKPLTPSNLGYSPGDIITFRAILLGEESWGELNNDVYCERDFRVIVSGDPNILPKLTHWYLTDVHYHSWDTDNEWEYGGVTEFTALAGRRIGLDCITITDHSCDMDNIEWYCDNWPNNNTDNNWNFFLPAAKMLKNATRPPLTLTLFLHLRWTGVKKGRGLR